MDAWYPKDVIDDRRFKETDVKQARLYLKETFNIDKLDKEASTDGWTLIALANSIYEKNN